MSTTRRQVLTALVAAPLLSLSARASGRAQQEPDEQQGEKRRIPHLAATLILVRHTEKSTNDRVDPDLSDAGRERAVQLARLFSAAGVTTLVHSEYKRTRDTLAPLAKQLDIEAETIGASDEKALIERLSSAKADEVIVVAGHSNTIPGIAYTFGVTPPDLDMAAVGPNRPCGYLPHDAYDRVYVLTPCGKTARLVELRYGKPS